MDYRTYLAVSSGDLRSLEACVDRLRTDATCSSLCYERTITLDPDVILTSGSTVVCRCGSPEWPYERSYSLSLQELAQVVDLT